jgi:hypothetical protein
MTLRDRLIQGFEYMLIGLALAWTLVIVGALVQPQLTTERPGTVEIYSLVAANDSGAAI